MFLVQIQEVWNWDVHLVVSPNQVGSALLFLFLDSLSSLVKLNGLLDRVRDALEYFPLVAPEHTLLHDFEAVNSL